MGNVLDVIVDGEIVTEALLLEDHNGMEQLIYSGSGSSRTLYELLYSMKNNLSKANYCVVQMNDRKYVALRLSENKYLIVNLDPSISGEEFVDKVTRFFEKLRHLARAFPFENGPSRIDVSKWK
ncbi:MAG: hypothetical protein DRJ31_04700 [Candidatus Methanomethylicota archaeon]|uniref:Roadblock/LAMTOR2 domain-containing protein n=1 Tax=Thermoproteota archaeon TaxID=2056631 RepID=A0A497EQW8_9CREN|nr:MAG: hypothetical protein DRJ31_04700 [Candidatus Verstraetearchaeota archaeon]